MSEHSRIRKRADKHGDQDEVLLVQALKHDLHVWVEGAQVLGRVLRLRFHNEFVHGSNVRTLVQIRHSVA